MALPASSSSSINNSQIYSPPFSVLINFVPVATWISSGFDFKISDSIHIAYHTRTASSITSLYYWAIFGKLYSCSPWFYPLLDKSSIKWSIRLDKGKTPTYFALSFIYQAVADILK